MTGGTVVASLSCDRELRFTASGAAVASFTIAATPRSFDRASNEWKDSERLFLRCSIWRQAAKNVSESLRRGMRVVAQGRPKQRTYETSEGEKRTVVELDVDEVGPSLHARPRRSTVAGPSMRRRQTTRGRRSRSARRRAEPQHDWLLLCRGLESGRPRVWATDDRIVSTAKLRRPVCP